MAGIQGMTLPSRPSDYNILPSPAERIDPQSLQGAKARTIGEPRVISRPRLGPSEGKLKRLLAVATTLASAPDADAQNYPAPKEALGLGPAANIIWTGRAKCNPVQDEGPIAQE